MLAVVHRLRHWCRAHHFGIDLLAAAVFEGQGDRHHAAFVQGFAPTVPGGGTLLASFNANLLELPIRRDEAALTTFLEGAPGKLTTLYRRDREMVIRVRDLLRAELPTTLSLDDIAASKKKARATVASRMRCVATWRCRT